MRIADSGCKSSPIVGRRCGESRTSDVCGSAASVEDVNLLTTWLARQSDTDGGRHTAQLTGLGMALIQNKDLTRMLNTRECQEAGPCLTQAWPKAIYASDKLEMKRDLRQRCGMLP